MSILDAIKNSVLEGFDTTITASEILLNLGVALLAGLFILLIYKNIQRSVTTDRGFGLTLLLVCAISAMIVLTITSNLALSLGMVGALSIVRFRTAIKDAADTAFMFWAVAAGITSGAGFHLLTLIGCLCIGVICVVGALFMDHTAKPFLLVVRAEEIRISNAVEEALKKGNVRYKLSSLVENPGYAELIYELGFSEKKKAAILSVKEITGVVNISLVDCGKA